MHRGPAGQPEGSTAPHADGADEAEHEVRHVPMALRAEPRPRERHMPMAQPKRSTRSDRMLADSQPPATRRTPTMSMESKRPRNST
eukprot:4913588-Alexandrium_andersonii.AAC.1